MGEKQEHIGKRYSLFMLVSDDRFVVQATEEFASSADILIVDPRQCNAQGPKIEAVGRSSARPPPKVGIGRIPTGGQYVPNTELCRVDANFENPAQFLRQSMSITTRDPALSQYTNKNSPRKRGLAVRVPRVQSLGLQILPRPS